MARFSLEDSENYGASTRKYFNLKNDGDVARIRFLYKDINDIEGVAVHEIEVGGKRMDVECLRAYNEPTDNCPLCREGYKVSAKLFIPVYDEDDKESKIWTRGRTFFQKLSSLCSRYNPLVSTSFEVERCGKAGDTKTTYELYPHKTDNARVEDFPEVKAEGNVFESKTFNELEAYLELGDFPTADRDVGTHRRSQSASRQTPATPIRRRPQVEEDSF